MHFSSKIFLGLWFLAMASTTQATLYLQEYQPERHDRFYTGEDKAFLGDDDEICPVDLDFSGVGKVSNTYWVTMISPEYFLTSSHYFREDQGDIVTFYEGNVQSDEFKHEYVVDRDYSVALKWNGVTSDLMLGRLTEPISPEDDIATYPILNVTEYLDMELLVYGKTDRVGRNAIDELAVMYRWNSGDSWGKNPPGGVDLYSATSVMEYNLNLYGSEFGGDEAYLQSGDSGGPSFAIWGNALSLVGIHYYNEGTPANGRASGDSFVPDYIGQIEDEIGFDILAVLIEGDLDGDRFVGGSDLDVIRSHWGENVIPGDLTRGDISGDGYIGGEDLDIVRMHWGEGMPRGRGYPDPSVASVPEPTGITLALAGFVALAGGILLRRYAGKR